MMATTSIYLIEKNAVFREGLKTVLEGTPFSIRLTMPDVHGLANDHYPGPGAKAGHQDEPRHSETRPQEQVKAGFTKADLVIVGINEDIKNGIDAVECKLENVNKAFPRARVAVISDYADPATIRASFRTGVQGYMLSDISPKALTAALSMIMAGEKVCPAPVLDRLISPAAGLGCSFADDKGVDVEVSSYDLSRREMEVLRYLTSGNSNKEIARSMDVTEATIKVHVKSLLRKLDLSNRTQAAVWAVLRGLREQESCSVSVGHQQARVA